MPGTTRETLILSEGARRGNLTSRISHKVKYIMTIVIVAIVFYILGVVSAVAYPVIRIFLALNEGKR